MKMEKFVKLMTGHFDNREQFTEMKSAGKLFPYARHVNTVCNDKINNIPENFTGIFMVEESYYETDGKCHASPHLFLITDCDGGIMLSSYEIPAGEDKNTFSYASMKNVEYSDLKRSEKFTPALYQEKDGVWEGGSVSQFTPVMTFRLWERFSETCLEVSESMEVNGKKTFGFKFHHFAGINIPFLNQTMPCHNNKKLPLTIMPMLPLGNPRLTDIDRNLSTILCMHKFRILSRI